MIGNKPTKYLLIAVVLMLLASIVYSMADSLGPTPEEIKNTLSYAGIKNGVTFSIGNQTYAIDNITVSKEIGNRYSVHFSTRISQ